jgi:flagellar assembly protein FliH
MNRVIRTARISPRPVFLPIHIDRDLVELGFVPDQDEISEEEFGAAQAQDVEESNELGLLEEELEEEIEEEPRMLVAEAEAMVEARLHEAETSFLEEKVTVRQEGLQAGQEKGYAEGHAAGLAEGQAQSQDEIARFQAMIGKISERWDRLFKSVDLDLVNLAIAIAENVVGGAIKGQEDLVLDSVRACLRHLQDTKQLKICVNPDDLAIVRANRTRWQETYERIESVTIEADESIGRGGCVIETPSGQISSRLDKLQIAILERMQSVPGVPVPDVSTFGVQDETAEPEETQTEPTRSIDENKDIDEDRNEAPESETPPEPIVAETSMDAGSRENEMNEEAPQETDEQAGKSSGIPGDLLDEGPQTDSDEEAEQS